MVLLIELISPPLSCTAPFNKLKSKSVIEREGEEEDYDDAALLFDRATMLKTKLTEDTMPQINGMIQLVFFFFFSAFGSSLKGAI